MTEYPFRRRDLLKTTGAGLAGVAGLSLATPAAAEGDEIWTFQTGESVQSSPTVVDGTVFVGSFDNNVYALDAATGEEEWTFQDDRIGPSTTVVDDTVFVGSNFISNSSTSVYALDAASGEEKWTFDTSGEIGSSPTVVDGTVFVGNEDGVHALDAATGEERWTFQIDDDTIVISRSSPTVVDGTVFIGSLDNNVYALDAATGEEEWTFETNSQVRSSPTVLDGTLFVGSGFIPYPFTSVGTLYALDVATGEEEWTFQTDKEVTSSPTVVDRTVFFGSGDSNVYALDVDSGTVRWQFPTGGTVQSSPTVVEDKLFVGSTDGNVYAIEAGVSGSSEGSRVNLGTLGHHHVFAERGPTGPGLPDADLAASFSFKPVSPETGETITFDASASEGDIDTYRWDFTGDSETDATGETAEYLFEKEGEVEVTLTVVGAGGDEATAVKSFEVTQPVTIEATRTSTTVKSPVTVQVTDPPNDAYEYRWKVDKKPDESDPGLLHGQNYKEPDLAQGNEESEDSEAPTLGQKPRERKPHAVLRPDKPTGDSEPYELEVEVYDENEELIGSQTTKITVKKRKLKDVAFSIEEADTVSELVETYAPVLHFHSKEEYFPTRYEAYVENSELRLPDGETIKEVTLLDIGKSDLDEAYDPTDEDNSLWLGESETQFKSYQKRYPPTVYANVTTDEDESYLALTYWFFYLFDPKSLPDLPTEITPHPSDTECITILIKEEGQQWVAAAQHKSGEYVEWGAVEKSYLSDSGHIKVFPAWGSHSSFLVNTEKFDDYIPYQPRWTATKSTRPALQIESAGDVTEEDEDKKWSHDGSVGNKTYDIAVFPDAQDENDENQPLWTQFAGYFDAEPGTGIISDKLTAKGRLPMERGTRWTDPGSWITNSQQMLPEKDVLDDPLVLNNGHFVRDDSGCVTAFEVTQIRYQDGEIQVIDGWQNPGVKPHEFFIDATVKLLEQIGDQPTLITDPLVRRDNLRLGWNETGEVIIPIAGSESDGNKQVEVEVEVLTHEPEAGETLSGFPVSGFGTLCRDEALSVSLGEVNL